uniref:Uncharacterized protein n=1 Tax=Anguilla anguilla TaxID=7936 RepID=A0A0E9XKS1_ANGAN
MCNHLFHSDGVLHSHSVGEFAGVHLDITDMDSQLLVEFRRVQVHSTGTQVLHRALVKIPRLYPLGGNPRETGQEVEE